MRDTTDFKDRFQRWKGGTPINELYDCGKALKKYDTGTGDEDNPWIPKGTKVATQNSEPVSAKPKTTVASASAPTILDTATNDTKIQYKKKVMQKEALDDMQDNLITKWAQLTVPQLNIKQNLPLVQGFITGLFNKNRERLLNGAQASVLGDTPNLLRFLTNVPVSEQKKFRGVFRPTDGETAIPSDRDLTRLAVLGEDKNFVKYKGDPLSVNGKTYDYINQYVGQIFPYTKLPVPENIYNLLKSYSKTQKLLQMPDNIYYGKGDGTYNVLDNVAKHGAAIKQNGEQLYYHPYDIWDFAGDYKYSIVPYMNDLFQSAIAPNKNFPNSGTFALRQDVPIVIDNEAYKNPAFKGFVHAIRKSDNPDEQLYNVLKDYMTQNADGFPLNEPDERVNFDIDYDKGKSIHIKPANRGKLTALKKRTGKSEAELYNDGNPAHKKMIVFARNARRWKH